MRASKVGRGACSALVAVGVCIMAVWAIRRGHTSACPCLAAAGRPPLSLSRVSHYGIGLSLYPGKRTVTNKRPAGFTLLELLISISLLAILLVTAVPSFRSAIQNNRLTTQTNDLVTALQLARTEALKRATAVSVCASDTTTATPTCGSDWTDGWMVVVDANAPGASSVSIGERLRLWSGLTGGTTVGHNGEEDFVRYLPDGSIDRVSLPPPPSGNAPRPPWTYDLAIPHCTGDHARQLEIGSTGRISVTRVEC